MLPRSIKGSRGEVIAQVLRDHQGGALLAVEDLVQPSSPFALSNRGQRGSRESVGLSNLLDISIGRCINVGPAVVID